MSGRAAFGDLLQRRGAVCRRIGGTPVPLHFGHPQAELAACLRGVGLAARLDLVVTELAPFGITREDPAAPSAVRNLRPGGVVLADGSWWGMSDAGTLMRALSTSGASCAYAAHGTRSAQTVLQLRGPKAWSLLGAVAADTVPGDFAASRPHFDIAVEDHRVGVFALSASNTLLTVPDEAAGVVWNTLEASGRQWRICRVGLEAVHAFDIHELRTRPADVRLDEAHGVA